MVTPRQYATAGALRAALETRLLERSRRDDVDLQRLRRQVAFDRLLARMFDPAHAARDHHGNGISYLRCARAKAHPEPDLRYCSNLMARVSSANSTTTSTCHGPPVAV